MNNIEEIKTLNPYQQEAVLDESPACLVNANVGSGKTTVLIEKVRHLHEKKQVSYEKMAVLTFTNKAADEIAERLSRKEAELTEEELWGFGTFHSVALRILRRFLPEKAEDGTKLEEWNREFTVITPEDEMEMVLAIAKEGGYKIKYQNRLKKRMEEDYAAYRKGRTQGKYKDDLFQIFPLLEKAKRQQNKMSFADLLEEGTQVAKEQEEVLDLKWIIVDEVQDSDEKQLKFLEEHPEVDALSGTIAEFQGDTLDGKTAETAVISYKTVPETQKEIAAYIKQRNPINHPCVMFRKSRVESAGGYQTCPYFEDYDLWVRMYKERAVFANLPDTLLYMRVNGMHQRRGGLRYAKCVIDFRVKMYRNQVITFGEFLPMTVVRVLVSLMPNSLRRFLYEKKLRKQQ